MLMIAVHAPFHSINPLCVVCMTRPRDTVIKPCRHFVLCKQLHRAEAQQLPSVPDNAQADGHGDPTIPPSGLVVLAHVRMDAPHSFVMFSVFYLLVYQSTLSKHIKTNVPFYVATQLRLHPASTASATFSSTADDTFTVELD